jgi:dihydrofolate reductase
MGKLIISTHITVDGVIGPDPSAWAILAGSGEQLKLDQLMAADGFVLGRKVYEGLAAYWPTATDTTGFAARTNELPKYVASRTLHEPLTWNASLIEGDLTAVITALKERHRGNLISLGPASWPSNWFAAGWSTRSICGWIPRFGATVNASSTGNGCGWS